MRNRGCLLNNTNKCHKLISALKLNFCKKLYWSSERKISLADRPGPWRQQWSLGWREFAEKVGFKPEVKEYKSYGQWEWQINRINRTWHSKEKANFAERVMTKQNRDFGGCSPPLWQTKTKRKKLGCLNPVILLNSVRRRLIYCNQKLRPVFSDII